MLIDNFVKVDNITLDLLKRELRWALSLNKGKYLNSDLDEGLVVTLTEFTNECYGSDQIYQFMQHFMNEKGIEKIRNMDFSEFDPFEYFHYILVPALDRKLEYIEPVRLLNLLYPKLSISLGFIWEDTIKLVMYIGRA